MSHDKVIEKLEHDLLSAIRNFTVAANLLDASTPDVAFASELLRASIEQLEEVRQFVQKNSLQSSEEVNQSMVAQD